MSYAPTLPPKARGVQPVEPHEVVEAVHAALSADDALCRYLGGGDASVGRSRLHAHRLPLYDASGAESASAPMLCLVRQRQALDGAQKRRTVTGARPVEVHVRTEADPDAVSSADARVSYAQVLAYDVLEDLPLDVTRGSGRFASVEPIHRTGEPDAPALDPRKGADGRLYASSVFTAHVHPAALAV